ncbi:MAG: UDP-N-acetylmuramoyl-L-alanyl-D-glutamate--2,6-diaminopimelate ligase [Oscillospiraceae bacterium]|nr:UDP-N-acetylmuramoyl-L-alanyl-D-glutamate--2,6-diaminopimelate ligase [Oscillospiraceae bacterium]
MRLFALLQVLDTLQTNAPSLDCEVDGVHNDTRGMKKGDLFVAVPGTELDGHCYIRQAMDIGASMIVTERPLDSSVPHVVVPDARAALAMLEAKIAGYPAEKMTMTGVTGTKGKTTVTHIIKGLIEGVTGQKTGLVGTNHILIGEKELPSERTTPDAVKLNSVFAQMAEEGCAHCVMEVSSHALAQSRVLGIHYEAGVFTNLHHEHMDYHTDMEDYFSAKSRLFLQSRKAIINSDDPYGKRLAAQIPDAIPFSLSMAENRELKPNGVAFTLSGERFAWGTPGLFTVYNVLAAVLTGAALGLPIADMARVLPGIPPVKGRMELVTADNGIYIYIDYAHTPDAIAAVLQTMKPFCKGRLIALFGCGGDRDKTKRPLMGAAAQRTADLCYVTSDNPRSENPETIISNILEGMENRDRFVEPDRRKAIKAAMKEAKPGDILMLLGKGHEEYQEICGVKHPFDEREVVRE